MISGGHISPIALRIPPPGSPARRTQTGPAREQRSVTWYDLACRFTDMKWPRLAARSRMSIADALATITPALVTTTRGRACNLRCVKIFFEVSNLLPLYL